MKKIHINKLVLMACCFGLFSCEELNESPAQLVPEGFYKTPTDVITGLNGAYAGLTAEPLYGRKLSGALMLRGDMVDIGDQTTSSARIQVNEFQADPSNAMVEAIWPQAYESIAAANSAITGAEGLNVSEEEKNALIAEGRFLRAFLHYHLVRLFGDIPYMTSSVIDPAEAYNLKSTPVNEVYDGPNGIIADLKFAKEWLPNTQLFRSRASKGTAASYLASVYLTRENWQAAYEEAQYVIDNSGLFGFGLNPDYQNLFMEEVSDRLNEMIFVIDFGAKDDTQSGSAYGEDYLAPLTGPRGDERFPVGEGWSVAVPSLKVFEAWNNADYRKDVSFYTEAIMDGMPTPYINWGAASRGVARPSIAKYWRFFGESGLNGRDSDLNIPAMRYAEVLLIAAEALNEVSGPEIAKNYVNEVRERARRELDAIPDNDNAFPANVPAGLSVDEFRDLVLEERRLELAFEFKRWYDIKRRQLGSEVFGAGGYEPHPNFDPSRDYLFPKPQSEYNLNSGIGQNSGY